MAEKILAAVESERRPWTTAEQIPKISKPIPVSMYEVGGAEASATMGFSGGDMTT